MGGAATARDRPLVSVGMSVRDNAATVELAVRSILRQSMGDFELILVDDGSTDGTLEILRSFDDARVRVVDGGTAQGLPARLNQTIDLARGELFARMDGDDIAFPDRFARQLDRLRAEPELDLIGAGMVVFRDDYGLIGARRPAPDHAGITASPTDGFGLAHPTFMGRTTFFRRWRYRPQAVAMEDQDLLLRAHRESRYGNVPEALLGYRESRLSLRKNLRARRSMAIRYGREHLDRGDRAGAARAVAMQAAKGAYDAVAIGLRLDYRLLRHRAQPVTAAEQAAWDATLASLGIDGPVT